MLTDHGIRMLQRVAAICDRLGKYALADKIEIMIENYPIVRMAGVDFATAVAGLKSKGNIRLLHQLYNTSGKGEAKEADIQKYVDYVIQQIPNDLNEKYKGPAVIWVKNQYLKTGEEIGLSSFIEKFFQLNRYVPPNKRDINNVVDIADLLAITNQATRDHHEKEATAVRGSSFKKKVQEGMEKIGENDNWVIYSPHNKEAAIELGNGTTWCTASRGDNNMFNTYYKPNDQLYVFINKKDPSEKYQFHYGSNQFMNKNDEPIMSLSATDAVLIHDLHSALSNIMGANISDHEAKYLKTNKVFDPVEEEDKYTIEDDKAKKTYLKNNKLHSFNDEPSVVNHFFGKKEWHYNGQLHRNNGPALTDHRGNEKWYQWGQLHRDDGPAVVDDENMWYNKGKFIKTTPRTKS